MNNHFIAIKSLQGDLKIAHKKHDFGLTVTTQELIFQKPHANYYIKLLDILSITPFELPVGSRPMRVQRTSASVSETVTVEQGMPHYRLYVREAVLHNRSGIFPLGTTQFIMPVHHDLLQAISRYGGLSAIE